MVLRLFAKIHNGQHSNFATNAIRKWTYKQVNRKIKEKQLLQRLSKKYNVILRALFSKSDRKSLLLRPFFVCDNSSSIDRYSLSSQVGRNRLYIKLDINNN